MKILWEINNPPHLAVFKPCWSLQLNWFSHAINCHMPRERLEWTCRPAHLVKERQASESSRAGEHLLSHPFPSQAMAPLSKEPEQTPKATPWNKMECGFTGPDYLWWAGRAPLIFWEVCLLILSLDKPKFSSRHLWLSNKAVWCHVALNKPSPENVPSRNGFVFPGTSCSLSIGALNLETAAFK